MKRIGEEEMNFYEIVSEEFTNLWLNYYEPPETTRFFEVVFAPTRSKAKYKFYKKYKEEVNARSFKDFIKVSVRKIDLSDSENREFVQEVVFKNQVLQ